MSVIADRAAPVPAEARGARTDRSMVVMERVVALLAIAAAVLVAFAR